MSVMAVKSSGMTKRWSCCLSYALILCGVWLITSTSAETSPPALHVEYNAQKYIVHMEETELVEFTINNLTAEHQQNGDVVIHIYSANPDLLSVEAAIDLPATGADHFSASFNMTGVFLGKAQVLMNLTSSNGNFIIGNTLEITVIRRQRVIDKLFTASVITLVSALYCNFGCALDWTYLRRTIKKPIGPVIGFCSQFVIMPLLSFYLGRLLFPNSVEMQLGMFFTGVSPAGGASNIWTCILGGNMNLSVTMTTISTFAAFGMMPLWIFTLGRVIFSEGKLGVPYHKIATYAVALVVPLGIGYLIQKFKPRLSQVMVRILKPVSSCLIVFIIVFAIITNTYLFSLFSWQIVVAGLGLPWLGYFLGMIISVLLKQPPEDTLAIAIETGVQNTGIAIFLLRFSLPQPEADLTTVVPVAVAIMTPFPLMILLLVNKLRERFGNAKAVKLTDSIENFTTPITAPNESFMPPANYQTTAVITKE